MASIVCGDEVGGRTLVSGGAGRGVTKYGGDSVNTSGGDIVAPPFRVVSTIAPTTSAACASMLATVPPVRRGRVAFDSSRTSSMVPLRVVVVATTARRGYHLTLRLS